MKPGDLILVKETDTTCRNHISGLLGKIISITSKYCINVNFPSLSRPHSVPNWVLYEHEIQILSKEEYEAALVIDS